MSRAVLSTTTLVASIKRMNYSTSAAEAAVTRIESRARPVDSNPSTLNPKASSAASSSWVPDPLTGYYRPGNRHVETNAAEMREALLSHHKTRH